MDRNINQTTFDASGQNLELNLVNKYLKQLQQLQLVGDKFKGEAVQQSKNSFGGLQNAIYNCFDSIIDENKNEETVQKIFKQLHDTTKSFISEQKEAYEKYGVKEIDQYLTFAHRFLRVCNEKLINTEDNDFSKAVSSKMESSNGLSNAITNMNKILSKIKLVEGENEKIFQYSEELEDEERKNLIGFLLIVKKNQNLLQNLHIDIYLDPINSVLQLHQTNVQLKQGVKFIKGSDLIAVLDKLSAFLGKNKLVGHVIKDSKPQEVVFQQQKQVTWEDLQSRYKFKDSKIVSKGKNTIQTLADDYAYLSSFKDLTDKISLEGTINAEDIVNKITTDIKKVRDGEFKKIFNDGVEKVKVNDILNSQDNSDKKLTEIKNLVKNYGELKKTFGVEIDKDNRKTLGALKDSICTEIANKIKDGVNEVINGNNAQKAIYSIYSNLQSKLETTKGETKEEKEQNFLNEKIKKTRAAILVKILNSDNNLVIEGQKVKDYVNDGKYNDSIVKNQQEELKNIPDNVLRPNGKSIFPIEMSFDKEDKSNIVTLKFGKEENQGTLRLNFGENEISGIEIMESIRTMGLFNFMKYQKSLHEDLKVKFDGTTVDISAGLTIKDLTNNNLKNICDFSDLVASNANEYEQFVNKQLENREKQRAKVEINTHSEPQPTELGLEIPNDDNDKHGSQPEQPEQPESQQPNEPDLETPDGGVATTETSGDTVDTQDTSQQLTANTAPRDNERTEAGEGAVAPENQQQVQNGGNTQPADVSDNEPKSAFKKLGSKNIEETSTSSTTTKNSTPIEEKQEAQSNIHQNDTDTIRCRQSSVSDEGVKNEALDQPQPTSEQLTDQQIQAKGAEVASENHDQPGNPNPTPNSGTAAGQGAEVVLENQQQVQSSTNPGDKLEVAKQPVGSMSRKVINETTARNAQKGRQQGD